MVQWAVHVKRPPSAWLPLVGSWPVHSASLWRPAVGTPPRTLPRHLSRRVVVGTGSVPGQVSVSVSALKFTSRTCLSPSRYEALSFPSSSLKYTVGAGVGSNWIDLGVLDMLLLFVSPVCLFCLFLSKHFSPTNFEAFWSWCHAIWLTGWCKA